MSEPIWDIDELVGKIMADLRAASERESAATTGAALTRDFRSLLVESAKPSDSDVFAVRERVVFVDVVKKSALATASKRWTFRADAIVTPAARDEMAKLGVEWTRGEKLDSAEAPTVSASNVAPKTAERVLFANHLPEGEVLPETARDYIARLGADSFALSCLKETSKRIATELGADPSLRVVLTTREVAIAGIWTNRHSGVRSVVARDYDAAVRDFVATNANVAIVDPAELGSYRFGRIVDYFARRAR